MRSVDDSKPLPFQTYLAVAIVTIHTKVGLRGDRVEVSFRIFVLFPVCRVFVTNANRRRHEESVKYHADADVGVDREAGGRQTA
jgi:hypothetical protein